jgi:heme-degrading monooxygenase HmoA
MNRRSALKTVAAALPAAQFARGQSPPPIQLHLDLEVDPAKERNMLATFAKTFRPAISKQPGFVSVRLLKLRTELAGKAPANCPYRLVISFQTEEQRQTWIKTDLHQKVWPAMETSFKGSKYNALLYDETPGA